MKKKLAITLVLLLGKPGAGKGTRTKEFLEKHFNWRAFSTGDVLREEKAKGTPLGKRAQEYMDKGLLVPDYLMAEILKNSIENLKEQNIEGIILDGFPRNCTQIVIMQKLGIVPQKIIEIHVDDKEAVRRLSNRLTCSDSKCGKSYSRNGEKAPIHAGICDNCGSPLIVRSDDTPEKAEERLKVYHSQTAPVIPELQMVFKDAAYLKIPTRLLEGNDEELQKTFEEFLLF